MGEVVIKGGGGVLQVQELVTVLIIVVVPQGVVLVGKRVMLREQVGKKGY